MKIQVDTKNKQIYIMEPINFKNFKKQVKKLLNGQLDEYEIMSAPLFSHCNYWYYPPLISTCQNDLLIGTIDRISTTLTTTDNA